jgi:hypothetical protein
MSSKRQTTMAKLTRERKVKEKRELKAEKKAAVAAAKAAGTYGVEDAEVSQDKVAETPTPEAD